MRESTSPTATSGSDQVKDRWNELVTERDELTEKIGEVHTRQAYLEQLAASGEGTSESVAQRSEARNEALRDRQRELSESLRTVDRNSEAFRDDADAQALERHLRDEDPHHLNRRYVTSVGDPHYRSFFRKLLLAGGQVGMLDLTDKERAAFESWRQAESRADDGRGDRRRRWYACRSRSIRV